MIISVKNTKEDIQRMNRIREMLEEDLSKHTDEKLGDLDKKLSNFLLTGEYSLKVDDAIEENFINYLSEKNKKFEVKIINKSDNPLPEYKTSGSVGMDLMANESQHITSKETIRVKTGLFMQIPHGYEGNIKPRSGLSLNEELVAIEGTIDSDYRGEIGIIIRNNSDSLKLIKRGDRIAQIVFRKVEIATLIETDSLDETERGNSGFGSTGTN